MNLTTLERNVVQLRRILDTLHRAIRESGRVGNIRRDVHLTLRACRLRRQLIETQQLMGLLSE